MFPEPFPIESIDIIHQVADILTKRNFIREEWLIFFVCYSSYPSKKWKMLTNIENSKIDVSRHLDSSTTTQMAKIMVQYGRPSCSSWAESVRSSFGWTLVGKAIWENLIETWLGENSRLGMSLCSSWKGIILIGVCGWHEIGWKNKILIRCENYSTKKSIWENQHLFWIMCTWAALNDNVT